MKLRGSQDKAASCICMSAINGKAAFVAFEAELVIPSSLKQMFQTQ